MADQPPPAQPNLGYGKPTEATIDQVNIWMRSTPWYQRQMQAWGQDPGHPTLEKWQRNQILRQAQANGVVVDEGQMELDDHGNLNPKGHKLRNTLIVAGIAAATIATMGAAGVFAAGAAGAGGAAGGAGAGAAAAGAGAGAAGAGAGAAATGATLAGIEGGAYGIGAGTVGALGTGAMAAVPVAGTIGGAAATGGTLAALSPAATGGTAAGTYGPLAGGYGAATTTAAAPAGIAGTTGTVAGGGALATAGKYLSSQPGSALVGTGLNIAAQIYANKQAQDAADKAAQLSAEAQDKQLAYLREKDAQDQANFKETQQLNYGQWARRETQLAPVRASGDAAGRELAKRLNLDGQGGATYLPAAFDYKAPVPAYGDYMAYTEGGSRTGGGGADDAGDPETVAFIRDWQQNNSPTASPADLVAAAKAKGVNITPYMYGKTASNNEVTVNGQKFKIRGGEEGSNPYWYYGGDDSPGGGGGRSLASISPTYGRYQPARPIAISGPQSPIAGGGIGGYGAGQPTLRALTNEEIAEMMRTGVV